MIGDAEFCPICGVTMDLHPTCETAEKKARLLNRFAAVFSHAAPPSDEGDGE